MLVEWGKWYLCFYPFKENDENYIGINWLTRSTRYLGYEENWYDGPHPSFGLWFISIYWDFAKRDYSLYHTIRLITVWQKLKRFGR